MARRGFDVGVGRSYAEIEGLAASIRAFVAPGLQPAESLPGVELFERLDQMAVLLERRRIPLDYKVEEFPAGIDGETRHDKTRDRFIVTLAEHTYRGLEANDGRARFSFAHELAHAFLHAGVLLRLSRIPHEEAIALRRAERDHDTCFDSEWQADSTASALLMPAAGLELLAQVPGNLCTEVVSPHYDVSFKAAEVRISNFLKRRAQLTNL